MSEKGTDQEILLGRKAGMPGLVEYQSDAVVSRTLIKTPTGTVTLFAFDKDQGLSEHTTPFDALVQVLDGEAEFRIAEDSHLVKQGEAIILPANIPHAVQAVARFKMLLTMIRS